MAAQSQKYIVDTVGAIADGINGVATRINSLMDLQFSQIDDVQRDVDTLLAVSSISIYDCLPT